MATYDLIERLNTTFRETEHNLLTLTERLQTCRLLAARVFTLPDVVKGAEHDPLLAAEQLRLARRALDALTGRASTENMLDALFGRFCIGK